MRLLALNKIRIDGDTQPREAIDQATVDDYAEKFRRLAKFPPCVVYHDGVNTWLADGFHRWHAAHKAGVQTLDVDWREGTIEMARLYAASANKSHGLKRTPGDKKRAIKMVLSTAEGKTWSQKQIVKHCGVDPTWVARVGAEMAAAQEIPQRPPTATQQKRAAVQAAVAAAPAASNREIARRAGVSDKTVAAVKSAQAVLAPPPLPVTRNDAEEVKKAVPEEAAIPADARAALDGVRQEGLKLTGSSRAQFVRELEALITELSSTCGGASGGTSGSMLVSRRRAAREIATDQTKEPCP